MLGLNRLNRFEKGLLVATLVAPAGVVGTFAAAEALEQDARIAPVQTKTTEQGSQPVTEPAPPELPDDPLATPKPDEWKPKLERCHRRGSRRFCDGPRRVPEPHGEAKRRAERLDLGDRPTAGRLMHRSPKDAWVEAVEAPRQYMLQWPVEGGRYGRGFGFVRKDPRGTRHDGLDIVADTRTKVRAAAGGLVAYSGNGVSGFGNLVILVHADGTATLYAHMRAAYVFAGQRVSRGQVIGEVGSTGLARGPHLHFELRDEGHPRDPAPRMTGKPSEDDSS